MNPKDFIKERLEAIIKAFTCHEEQCLLDDKKERGGVGNCVTDDIDCVAASNNLPVNKL